MLRSSDNSHTEVEAEGSVNATLCYDDTVALSLSLKDEAAAGLLLIILRPIHVPSTQLEVVFVSLHAALFLSVVRRVKAL